MEYKFKEQEEVEVRVGREWKTANIVKPLPNPYVPSFLMWLIKPNYLVHPCKASENIVFKQKDIRKKK